MPIKQRNAITKADVEEALDYLGSSVSAVAKATNIPRSYLSDLKNRNVPLRREHDEKLRSFLQDQGVELESDAPAGRRDPANPSSPHPSVEVAQVMRRSLVLDDAIEDDVIATALDAQADRDDRLSQLFALNLEKKKGLLTEFFDEDGNYTAESKSAISEARLLLAVSYFAVGQLRGLRGFKAEAPEGEPKTIGEHFIEQFSDLLTKEPVESAEPPAPQEPTPKKSVLDTIL